MTYHNIVDNIQTRVDQMVKAGAFDDKSGRSNKAKRTTTQFKKKGAVNAVVKEEADGEETEGEDEKLRSREYLLWKLWISNTLVGNVNSIKEPATKSKGC